jgi:hypothetical protein
MYNAPLAQITPRYEEYSGVIYSNEGLLSMLSAIISLVVSIMPKECDALQLTIYYREGHVEVPFHHGIKPDDC